MSVIVVPRTRTRQPKGTVGVSALAPCLAALVPDAAGGRNYVNGQTQSVSYQPADRQSTQHGFGWTGSVPGGAGGSAFPLSRSPSPADAATLCALLYVKAPPTYNAGVAQIDPFGYAGLALSVKSDASVQFAGLDFDGTGLTKSVSGGTLLSGLVLVSGVFGADKSLRVYLNSALVGSGQSLANRYQYSWPTTIGPTPWGQSVATPTVYTLGVWFFPCELTSGQLAALSPPNHWSLFSPEYDTMFFGAAAGTSTTTVTVNAGSLTLTGQSVTDTVTAAVSAGTVALTGQNVALQRQTPVTAGSTSLTGQSIGITITVPISPGTLSLTGSDVTVVPPSGSFSIAVDPGALSLTGQAVTNLVTTPISEGSTSLTGQDVSVTTTVTVDPGSITLTGEVITVSYLGTQTIPIEPGTLSVTGRDVEVSITGGTKGGVGKGKNLTLKQKKKLKAVVSQEWLKAEQTAKELLQERLGNVEPAKVRVERLTTVQSLADVIAALQALSKETVTLPEQQAVIKSFEKSIDTKVIKTGERLVAVEDKVNETLGRIEKKIQNLEDLLIVVIDELL